MRSLLLIGLSLPLFAAETAPLQIDNDFRVTLSAPPRNYDSTLTNTKTDVVLTKGSGEIDSGGWLAVDYQGSLHKEGPVAILFGAGIDMIGMTEEDNLEKTSGSGVGVHLDVGVGVRPTEMFSMEASLVGGVGAASLTVDNKTTSTSLDSDSATYGMIALLARGVITFSPGFQIFGQIGYAGFNLTATYDATPLRPELEEKVELRGVTYGLGLGWRF